MSVKFRELNQIYHRKQNRLAEELGIEVLPRQKDRILHFLWDDIPLNFNQPRFGALETSFTNRPRGAW